MSAAPKPYLRFVTLAKPIDPAEIPCLRVLTAITYHSWGATEPTNFPFQNESHVDYAGLVHQLLRSSHSLTVTKHLQLISTILGSTDVQMFIKDSFWFFFLEYFALTDPLPHIERFKREAVHQAQEEAEKGVLRSSSLLQKRHLSIWRQAKDQRRSTVAKVAKVKAPTDPRSGPPKPVFVTPRERLQEKPVHLQTAREAFDSKRPRGLQGTAGSPRPTAPPSSARSAKSGRASSAHSQTASETGTALTIISMGSDISSPPICGTTSLRLEGRIDTQTVVAVLTDAFLREKERQIPSDDREAQDRAKEEAIQLIRREQDHMFGRMAARYVHLFQDLSSRKREVFFTVFPDLAARLVVQLLYRTVPYFRSLLTAQLKQSIKRTLTYWADGVETGDTAQWESTETVAAQSSEPFKYPEPTKRPSTIHYSRPWLKRSQSEKSDLKESTSSANPPPSFAQDPKPAGQKPKPKEKHPKEGKGELTAFPTFPKEPELPETAHVAASILMTKVRSFRGRTGSDAMNSSVASGAHIPKPPGADGPPASLVERRMSRRQSMKGDEMFGDRYRQDFLDSWHAQIGGRKEKKEGSLLEGKVGASAQLAEPAPISERYKGATTHATTRVAAPKRVQRLVFNHTVFHRHAPRNKPKPRWNEAGKSSSHAPKKAMTTLFNLSSLSPLLSRFLRDQAPEDLDVNLPMFMEWSTP